MKRLNQSDKGLINMVKSLVGKVEIVKTKECYQIVFYSNKDAEYLDAVERAVRGRIGEKFLTFEREKNRCVINIDYGNVS